MNNKNHVWSLGVLLPTDKTSVSINYKGVNGRLWRDGGVECACHALDRLLHIQSIASRYVLRIDQGSWDRS